MTETPPPLLDEAQAALINGPVAINVGARGTGGVPVLTRAVGCRLAPDRARVRVFVAASRAGAVLEAVHTDGRVALVVNRPTTHESIQLKGRDAVVGPLEEGDAATVAAYHAAWVAELASMGYSEAYARALVAGEPDDLVAVTFTASAAFLQTPGPDAGRRLDA